MNLKIALVSIISIVIILLIPFLIKDREIRSLEGPSLSDFDYTEVFFDNQSSKNTLSGMLFLPDGEGPFTTAVIIHGSGSSTRNSTWYLSVTKKLLDSGLAVLLPDKRGSEKSEGEWIGADFIELSTDTISAIEFIKNQDIFQYSHIGIIGLSQGGWIAPIVANEADDLSFLVSMSGTPLTTDQQLLHEVTQDIEPYTYDFIAKLLAPFFANNISKKENVKSLMGFDPIEYWKTVDIPVLMAFGEDDKNIPVNESIQMIENSNLDHFIVKLYPNGGHGILDINENYVSPEYLQDLVDFISNSTTE